MTPRARRVAIGGLWRPLVAVTASLLFAVVLLVWFWSAGSERRSLRHMQTGERGELYARTLRTTEALCAPPPRDPALSRRCQDFTDFLQAFPECDDNCQALAQSLRRSPTR
jgi:hypothetical protein